MKKVQEALLNALGLELEQEFEFEYTPKNVIICKFRILENDRLCFGYKSNGNEHSAINHILLSIINNPEGNHSIKKPILDEAEKKYLEGVLRPFKNRVNTIELNGYTENLAYLHISLNADFLVENDSFSFPLFKIGTMYKGMKLNKEYTLEELGLFEE